MYEQWKGRPGALLLTFHGRLEDLAKRQFEIDACNRRNLAAGVRMVLVAGFLVATVVLNWREQVQKASPEYVRGALINPGQHRSHS